MNIRKKVKIGDVITYTILGFWSLICIFPLYWMLTFSLKDNSEIFGENVIGLPRNWLWSNYQAAMTTGNIGLYLLNSAVVTGFTILFTVVFALMAAYALKRLVWKGRDSVNSIFMLGITVPIHAAILPIFLMLNKFERLDSYEALIIPYTGFALAMAIMICNGFIENIPKELEESACIDGCSVFGIFFRIILPLMRPAISTIAIFTFLQAWNELMFAVIFIDSERFRTISVGIQTLSGSYTTKWGPIGAALVIATLPTILLYTFFSKKIQESLMAGAIKG